MTKAEEGEVRKIIYEELTGLFRHVSDEAAKADDAPGADAPPPEALIKLLLLAARDRYMNATRPY